MENFKSIQYNDDNKDSNHNKSLFISPEFTNHIFQLATDQDTPPTVTIENKKSHYHFLDDIYIKYSVNLVEYFSNNREGMKLTGNKHFSKFPYYLFIEERKKQLKEITDRLKKAKLTVRSNETIDFKDQHFLTPLPNKSRKLMITNKELNEFRSAERVAVMMRIYEYTHGLKSKFAMEEYQEMVNEEKKQSLLHLKDVVNKIEGWWKGIKRKHDKKLMEELTKQKESDRIEQEKFNKQYSKYLLILNEKNKEKATIKICNVILKKLIPLKKQFLSKVKILAVCKKTDRFTKYKKIQRNMNNWLQMSMKLTTQKDHDMSYSIITNKKIHYRVMNDSMMFIDKKTYIIDNMKRHILCLRKAIQFYLNKKKEREKQGNRSVIFLKPKINQSYIDRSFISYNITRRNAILIKLINTKDHKSSFNDYVYSIYLKRWRQISINIQKSHRQSYINNFNKFSIKYLATSLSDIFTNNKQLAMNKIIDKQRSIKKLNKLSKVFKLIAAKAIIESLQHNISKQYFIKALTLIMTKSSLYSHFINWKSKVVQSKTFIDLIKQYSMNLSFHFFINNLGKIDKTAVTTYTTINIGSYDDDNEFKYYSIINRAKHLNDFYFLRITLGIKQIIQIIHVSINIKSIYKHIKHYKKKKNISNQGIAQLIPINPRLSSKFNQFTKKLNQLNQLIVMHYQSNFFHRMVLNHLVNSALHIDNRELISLLKLGQANTYQTVLNRVLELNLTENKWENNNITLISYVQRFITDTSNSSYDLIV